MCGGDHSICHEHKVHDIDTQCMDVDLDCCAMFHAEAAQFMSRYQNDDDTHHIENMEDILSLSYRYEEK